MAPGEHEQVKILLGAYVLNLLTPAERSGIEAHLVGCVECRAHYEYLRPVPGYLGMLSTDDLATLIDDRDDDRNDGQLDERG
jgi:anti-sigma factor RsiW